MTRYDFHSLIKGIKQPKLVIEEVRRLCSRSVNYIYHTPRRTHFNMTNTYTTNPLMKDWDNMFILDACRYDIFERISDQDSEPIIVDSSNSLEYVNQYMVDYKFEDTIYVTANPFGSQLSNTFYKKRVTFQTDESGEKADVADPKENWSPEYVYEEAIKSFESDKK